LKACNHYRLYNSKAAENELKSLKHLATSDLSFGKDIVLHNTVSISYMSLMKSFQVVFRSGDGALQILPALVDVIPEARMNLCIYHLKKSKLFIR
jgi:intraflagellar transport protein 56